MADIATILRLRRRGKTFRDIAEQVDLTHERVRQVIDQHGDPWTVKARLQTLEERKQKIIRLFHAGLSQQAIADALGMRSHTRVGDALREAGLSRLQMNEDAKRAHDAEILALRQQGLTFKAIAERLNLTNARVVSKALLRQGVVWHEPVDRDEVVRLRLEGLTTTEIAERLGVNQRRVQYALRQANMTPQRGKRG